MSDGASRVEERFPVSPWYHRRMGLVAGLMAVLSGYFFYDGYLGYPEDNRWVDQYEAFDPKEVGKTWAEYAAQHGRPAAAPERHPEAAIRLQKHLGAAGLVVLSGLLIVWTWQARRVWKRLESGAMRAPGGQIITADEVTSVDLAKWDRGIAFLEGPVIGRVRIDDYRYVGLGEALVAAGILPEKAREITPSS